MAHAETLRAAAPAGNLNVADRLAKFAEAMPDSIAVICPRRRARGRGKVVHGKSGAVYTTITFAELDADATRIARGLAAWGVPKGTRLALMVKPGIEFVTLVFALLRAGMVIVLVDPGLGCRNLIRCLSEAEPEGFVAIGAAQAARLFLRRKFPRARWNVTVGRRWLWGGKTLKQLRIGERNPQSAIRNPQSTTTHADDPAAIIFTSGSTGPPKGVLYSHRMFDTQVEEIQSAYDIKPGGIDLACFPLFALFNAAMGVTTVMPEMDFSRPATADPKKLLAAANDWQVTQAFASPAVWRVLSEHCAKSGERIESLRLVFSCGAPVPANVLQATLACVGAGAKMHTPYGATECLPISTIEASEVLQETAAQTDRGAGVCVGRKFESIEWRIIRITDEPIASIDDAEELPNGEIGELIARGPQVSPMYVTSSKANATAKIGLSSSQYSVPSTQHSTGPFTGDGLFHDIWHRTGDVGYFDEQARFWYCGRKSQRVETSDGPLYTECVEAVFNQHPDVARSALIGLGARGEQVPCVFYQPVATESRDEEEVWQELRLLGQQFPHTRGIKYFTDLEMMPVDVRHNSKILREVLVDWAETIDLLYCWGLKPKS
jgi:acyl-CoA synthetase (AMP-forming)/AMP-acid ligase II